MVAQVNVMPSEHKRHFWVPLLRRSLTFIGIVGVLGSATQAYASVEPECSTLEARVTAAREIIRNLEKDTSSTSSDKAPGKKLVQYYPWGNWGNWGNWNNWRNY